MLTGHFFPPSFKPQGLNAAITSDDTGLPLSWLTDASGRTAAQTLSTHNIQALQEFSYVRSARSPSFLLLNLGFCYHN